MNNTNWKKVKLGDICTIKTGKLNANAAVENGEYAFFTCSRETFRTDRYSFDGEALLIAGNGDVGFTKYYSGKFDAYQRTYVLMNFSVNIKYIYYYLQRYLPARIEAEMMGSAVPYIKLGTLSDMEIQVPSSLEEQRRIASLLSRFDELIQLHEFKADNLIKAKQQIMSDIFSGGLRVLDEINPDDYVQDDWITVKLGDITNLLDKMRKPISKNNRVAGEYPYYGANGIQDYINGYIFNGRYILVGEDGSVITKDNTPVVNWGTGKFWANNHVHILEAKDGFDIDFIFYAISNVDISGYVHGNIPKYTKGDLVDTQVKIPPTLEEQQKIANLLSSYDSLIELKQSQKQQVTNMKQQLMTQLLTNGGGAEQLDNC